MPNYASRRSRARSSSEGEQPKPLNRMAQKRRKERSTVGRINRRLREYVLKRDEGRDLPSKRRGVI